MKIINNSLGIIVIEPKVFGDSRGFFLESFQSQRYREIGINVDFVQDNISRSGHGVLRGLHYQLKHAQGKLVTVIAGEVLDVAVDIRCGSPTFGQYFSAILSGENHKQLYVPPGFAHGFCVLSSYVDFYYKCTNYYNPSDEYGVLWNDEDVGIKWSRLSCEPILSQRDMQNKRLKDISVDLLPKFVV